MILQTCRNVYQPFKEQRKVPSEQYQFKLLFEERNQIRSISLKMTGLLKMAVRLCYRCQTLAKPESETLWYRLFDTFVAYHQQCTSLVQLVKDKNSDDGEQMTMDATALTSLVETSKNHLRTIFNAMMEHITNPNNLLLKLVQDPRTGLKFFGDFREIFVSPIIIGI
jgi:hypothetical protein